MYRVAEYLFNMGASLAHSAQALIHELASQYVIIVSLARGSHIACEKWKEKHRMKRRRRQWWHRRALPLSPSPPPPTVALHQKIFNVSRSSSSVIMVTAEFVCACVCCLFVCAVYMFVFIVLHFFLYFFIHLCAVFIYYSTLTHT